MNLITVCLFVGLLSAYTVDSYQMNIFENVNNQLQLYTCEDRVYYPLDDIYSFFKHDPVRIADGVNSFTNCSYDYERRNWVNDTDPQNSNIRISYNHGLYGDLETDRAIHIAKLVTSLNYTELEDTIKSKFFLSLTGFAQYYPAMHINNGFKNFLREDWFLRTLYSPRSVVFVIDHTSLMFYNNDDYNHATYALENLYNEFPPWFDMAITYHGCDDENTTLSSNFDSVRDEFLTRKNCRHTTTHTPTYHTITRSLNHAFDILQSGHSLKSVVFISNGKTDLLPNEDIDSIVDKYRLNNITLFTINTISEDNSFLQDLACRGDGAFNRYNDDMWNFMELFELDTIPEVYTVPNIDPNVRQPSVSYLYPAYGYNGGTRYVIGVHGYTESVHHDNTNKSTQFRQ